MMVVMKEAKRCVIIAHRKPRCHKVHRRRVWLLCHKMYVRESAREKAKGMGSTQWSVVKKRTFALHARLGVMSMDITKRL